MEGFLPFTVIDLHTQTHAHTDENIPTVSVLPLSIVKVISYAVEYLTNTVISEREKKNNFWSW